MLKYIFRRLLMMIPVVLGVSLVVFTLLYITPGNPAQMILGPQARQEDIQALEEELHLNDPFIVRYGRFVMNAAQFDLGSSYSTKRQVGSELLSRFPNTLILTGLSLIIALFIGIPLGIISATKQYSIFDNLATVFGLVGVSIPNFWLGLMLMILFALNLKWVPPSGFSTPIHWILPSITLATGQIAMVMRMTRSSMLEVIRQDYIRTARAKGQKESIVVWRHAFRNALIPVVTAVGISFGGLLGGAILTETVFAIPGIGSFMVDSIRSRDQPVILGGVLFLAVSFSIVNLIVDILYAYLDPRIKSQYK